MIIANSINDVCYREGSEKNVSVLDAVAFQELWTIQRNDVIVTARPIPASLIESVCRIRQISPRDFVRISADCTPRESVIAAALRPSFYTQLSKLVRDMPDLIIRSLALDIPLLELATRLGLRIEGYDGLPSIALVEQVRELNTKTQFRALANSMGLQIPKGISGLSKSEVSDAAIALSKNHEQIVIKCDRGTGAEGQLTLIKRLWEDDSAVSLPLFLDKCLTGSTFVVEERVIPVAEPSVDAVVTSDGYRPMYIGAMSVREGSFAGMEVPAGSVSSEAVNKLLAAAEKLGSHLFQIGYRGYFDIDAAVLKGDGDEVVMFEANVRRTSTSLWEEVLSLFAHQSQDYCWRVKSGTWPTTFDPQHSADSISTLEGSIHTDDPFKLRLITSAQSSLNGTSIIFEAANTSQEVANM